MRLFKGKREMDSGSFQVTSKDFQELLKSLKHLMIFLPSNSRMMMAISSPTSIH